MTNTKEEWLRRLDGDAAQAEQAATELLTDADRSWMRGTRRLGWSAPCCRSA